MIFTAIWPRTQITSLATVFWAPFQCAVLRIEGRRVCTLLIPVCQMVYVKTYLPIKLPINRTRITGGRIVAILDGAVDIACPQSAILLRLVHPSVQLSSL
jgi:hypothetical protein